MMFWISFRLPSGPDVVQIGEHLVQKPIDLRLFRCGGLLLAEEPEVDLARRAQNVLAA